jgi:hypothetical protein
LNSNKYKKLTAIWVLSCNDEPAVMTYESIKQRIGNTNIDEVRNLVKEFPELFQITIPEKHLVNWKNQMRDGQNRSKWIAKEGSKVISQLQLNDVFRNRFRNSNSAKPVDKSILEWGFNYINEIVLKKEKEKQHWLVLVERLILPVLSVIVVACSGYWVYENGKDQMNLLAQQNKINQINTKREHFLPTYNKLTEHIGKSLFYGFHNNFDYRANQIKSGRIELYKLMPFVNKSVFDSLKTTYTEYSTLLMVSDSMQNRSIEYNNKVFQKYSELQVELWEGINKEFTIEEVGEK